MSELNAQLKKTVERTKKDYEQKQGATLQQCSVELYEVSDSYDSKSVLQKIKTYCLDNKAQYVIARHDKDFFSENTFNSRKELVGVKGQKKADHYHILIHLPYRMNLNDLALKIGVEERWIMIIKKEKGFDDMIWYVTHEGYDPLIKAHYDYNDFETNIPEYVEFIVNQHRLIIQNGEKNIVHDFLEIVSEYDKKISYQQFYQIMNALEYGINDVKQYYQMLKDILMAHNTQSEISEREDDIVDRKFIEAKAKDKDMLENITNAVDQFGVVSFIDDQNKQYVVTNAQIKKKGQKK